MSLVTYNGVSLPYPLHQSFRQEAVYDESGTDRILTKFDLSVQCLISSDYLDTIAPDLNPLLVDGPARVMNAVRDRLLQQRRTLSVKCGGVELIPSQTQTIDDGLDHPQYLPGQVDAANGPRPQSCTLVALTNNTFVLTFHVIAHYWEGGSDTTIHFTGGGESAAHGGANVLYNRWSETMEIDGSLYTKRVREGKFVIRSDNLEGLVADDLRTQMAVLSVPQGFVRDSAHYTVAPDGLAMAYRIVDREVYRLPPYNDSSDPFVRSDGTIGLQAGAACQAYEASGYYSESTPAGGTLRFGECYVKLRGAKGFPGSLNNEISPQWKLIRTAVAICSNKLNLAGAVFSSSTRGFSLLDTCQITTQLYDNVVEVRMRAQLHPKQSTTLEPYRVLQVANLNFQNIAGAPLFSLGGVPGRDAGATRSPTYYDRGTASFLLQAAAYYDPSLRGVSLSNKGQMTEGLIPGQAGVVSEA